jgi:predicted nucleotidyltransferase
MSPEAETELRSSLRDAYRALESEGIAALVVGGVAISYHLEGEAVVDHDIDLFIGEDDVEHAMKALSGAGFDVTDTHPTWLFKGRRNGTTVDVLYRLGKILKLDAEMIERGEDGVLDGASMRFISREDLAVGQAGAAKPEVPGHWFESVELLRADHIDWQYVHRRVAVAPYLRAALLNYARHGKIDVPDDVLKQT